MLCQREEEREEDATHLTVVVDVAVTTKLKFARIATKLNTSAAYTRVNLVEEHHGGRYYNFCAKIKHVGQELQYMPDQGNIIGGEKEAAEPPCSRANKDKTLPMTLASDLILCRSPQIAPRLNFWGQRVSFKSSPPH